MSNEQQANKLAMREKVWPERNADEKLEALKQSLCYALIHIEELRETVRHLTRHQHATNGEVLSPMNDDRNYPLGYQRNRIPMALQDKP